jgi:hypothetical protein
MGPKGWGQVEIVPVKLPFQVVEKLAHPNLKGYRKSINLCEKHFN